jgi:hypothetical protein
MIPSPNPGETLNLCLWVTTASGLQPDAVCMDIASGSAMTAGRPVSLEFAGGPVGSGGAIRLNLSVGRESSVSLRAYDIAGRQVASIFDGRLPAGRRSFEWNAARLTPGMYFVRAKVGDQHFSRAVMRLR